MYFKKNKSFLFNISRSRLLGPCLAPHQGGLVKTKSSKASCWCGSDKATCEKAVLKSEDQVNEVFEDLLSEKVCQTEISKKSVSITSFARSSIKRMSMSDLHVGLDKNIKLLSFYEMKNVFQKLSITWLTCKYEAQDRVAAVQAIGSESHVDGQADDQGHEAAKHKLLFVRRVYQWDSVDSLCSAELARSFSVLAAHMGAVSRIFLNG